MKNMKLTAKQFYKMSNYKKQSPDKMKETATYNKKTYSKEIKELKFLVETKKANNFITEMYVAFIVGRKITDKMLNAVRKAIKGNTPVELEKKRLETGRLLSKLDMVKEVLHKANYHETYVWRSEDFLGSIEKQIRDRGTLSSKQKLALNKMYKRFNKRIETNG